MTASSVAAQAVQVPAAADSVLAVAASSQGGIAAADSVVAVAAPSQGGIAAACLRMHQSSQLYVGKRLMCLPGIW